MPRSLRQRIERLERAMRNSKPATALIERLVAERIRIDRELSAAGVVITVTPHGLYWKVES